LGKGGNERAAFVRWLPCRGLARTPARARDTAQVERSPMHLPE
jgi:hypothetical protein